MIASLLIILFQASVTRLIPLYAIGVFLSFTLSQTGMARRWWKSGHLKPDEEIEGTRLRAAPRSALEAVKMIINGFGAVCTFVVMIVFAVTKFSDGAWVIVILVPALVTGLFHHPPPLQKPGKEALPGKLRLAQAASSATASSLLIAGVHRGSLAALTYARTFSDDVTAVHVSIDPNEAKKVREKWASYGEGIRLVILDSPYRLLVEPVMDYIENLLSITPAQRDDHRRCAAVRPPALVGKPAPQPDRLAAALWPAVQARASSSSKCRTRYNSSLAPSLPLLDVECGGSSG